MSSNIKTTNDILKVGDILEFNGTFYDCVPEIYIGVECIGCEVYSICAEKGGDIKCETNKIILKEHIGIIPEVIPELVYPIVIEPGKSVEILGLKLLVEEGNSCKHCVLNNTVLCKQINCNEHKCHIGYTPVHLAE